jgi:hypothetical protein
MSVLLLGFLVLLLTKNSPFYKKLLALQTPSYGPSPCDHSIDKGRLLGGHADYQLYKDTICSGRILVIQHPLDPQRGQMCASCNSKIFCSYSRCICRNTN